MSGPPSWIVAPAGPASPPFERALVGGKAAALALFAEAAAPVPVPPWLVVTTELFEGHFAELAPELHALEGTPGAAELLAAGARLRERILRTPWPEAEAAALRDAVAGLLPSSPSFPEPLFAVRSSAPQEDAAEDSFAGQFDTCLGVRPAELPEAVRRCQASLMSERAINYRALKGHRAIGGMAVLIQPMVPARVAGVLFTRAPDAFAEMQVSAAFGLGEGVVSGRVPCDEWRLAVEGPTGAGATDAAGIVIQSRPAEKTHRVALGEAGPELIPIAPPDPEPCLDARALAALRELGLRVEARAGRPMDIEFAFEADTDAKANANGDDDDNDDDNDDASGEECDGGSGLVLLQARPITGRGRLSVFDNANIVESYPGLSSPLTYSFVREAYAMLFRRAGLAFGVPAALIDARQRMYANLVARIEGRIYYNLRNFYGLYTLIPGWESGAPAWERMIGLEHGLDESRRTGDGWTRLRWTPTILRCLVKSFALWWNLDRAAGRLIARTERVCAEVDGAVADCDDPFELMALHDRLVSEILERFEVTVINDFFVMITFDRLSRDLEGLPGVESGRALVNDLLCGSRDMHSVEPVRGLLELAAEFAAKPTGRALLQNLDGREAEVWRELHEDPAHAGLRDHVDAWLQDFGHRTIEELKLETPETHEDPAFLLRRLAECVRSGRSMADFDATDREIRALAERTFELAMRGRPVLRAKLRFLLREVRRTLRLRENLRLARARGFASIRGVFRRLGRVMARLGVFAEPGDIIWLTCEEVFGVITGGSVTGDLAGLIALRKADDARWRALSTAPRVVTRGVVGVARSRTASEAVDRSVSPSRLDGLGCSPGVCVGPARVVHAARDAGDVSGAVLVAPMTDPGWVFLMVNAAALVVEKGSLLSHTAIIGRELGIPTVVGVRDATRCIPEGAMVEVDGAKGTVRILDVAAEAPDSDRDAAVAGNSDRGSDADSDGESAGESSQGSDESGADDSDASPSPLAESR